MSDVLVQVTGACGRITLNRPRAMNALSLNMVEEVHAALAAWAADEDRLGHSAKVKSYLAEQVKENHLKAPLFSPSGRKFITALDKFLRKHGYLH